MGKKVGKLIKAARTGADMTQEQLADKLGVAYQSVSRWENGTTYPDMEFLPVLAGIFGVTVDELIGGEDSLKRFSDLSEAYLHTQLERGFHTLDFYKSVKM